MASVFFNAFYSISDRQLTRDWLSSLLFIYYISPWVNTTSIYCCRFLSFIYSAKYKKYHCSINYLQLFLFLSWVGNSFIVFGICFFKLKCLSATWNLRQLAWNTELSFKKMFLEDKCYFKSFVSFMKSYVGTVKPTLKRQF